MICASDIKTRYPGAFDTVDNDFIELLIEEAEEEISAAVWGSNYDRGLRLLTAHKIYTSPAVSGGSGGGSVYSGPITSKRIGDVSITYGQAQGAAQTSSKDLSSSSYGIEFLELRRLVQGGPVVPHYEATN
jgi:hypothetical protein